MLTLLLLRHARAASQEREDDAERALTAEGRADAVELGRFLLGEGQRPARALVSPAVRTRQTLQNLEKGSGWAVPATYDPALYTGTTTQLRAALSAVAEDAARVLLIGHNPAVAELALSITADGDPRVIEAMRARFSPCSLAVITFNRARWQDVDGGRLESFVTPEALRGRAQVGRRAS